MIDLHPLLRAAFVSLDQAEVTWALLRGADDLRLPDGDVDLLVAPHDQRAARAALCDAGFEELMAHGHGSHRFFIAYDAEVGHWLKVDVVTRLTFGSVDASPALTNAVLAERQRDEEWWTPTPRDAFWLLFLHLALDKPVGQVGLRDERWAELVRLAPAADGPSDSRTLAATHVDCEVVLRAAQETRRDTVTAAAVEAHRHVRPRRSLARRIGQRLGGRVAAGGRVVAVLGPDGAGKSTAVSGLLNSSPFTTRVVYMGLPKPGRLGAAFVRLPLGMFALYLGTVLALRAKVRVHRVLGRLVLLDRHPIDASASPNRGNLNRRETFKRSVVLRAAPNPDAIVVLDASAETMFARKGEHDIPQLHAMREGYLQIAATHPAAHLIDASRESAKVQQDLHALAWRLFATDESSGSDDHMRGSMLMLAGQLGSMVVTFAAQIIVVRHLTSADYGALAWAMAVVGVLQAVLPLGLDRVDSKFLSDFRERRDRPGLLWALTRPSMIVSLLGLVICVAVALAWPWLGNRVVADPVTGSVLLIVLALGPAQAIDVLLTNAFAVFAKPSAIFFRRYVLHPFLRLALVLVMVALDAGVQFLAWGYLITGVAVTLVYAVGLAAVIRRGGEVAGSSVGSAHVDRRHVFGLALPSLFAQVVALVYGYFAGVALGYFHSAESVAAFVVITPLAALNFQVLYSFRTLYLPQAGALQASGDSAGLRDLHWRTGCWVTLLSAPVFLLTVPFGTEVATSVLGHEYAASGVLLSIVSAGYFLSASTGFSGSAVLLFERRRWMWLTNIVLLAGGSVLQIVLIARWAELGAAIGVSAIAVAQMIFNQFGAGWRTPLGLGRRDAVTTLLTVVVAAAGCLVVAETSDPPLIGVFLIVGVISLALVKLNARRARITETFPELSRIPVVSWLVQSGPS